MSTPRSHTNGTRTFLGLSEDGEATSLVLRPTSSSISAEDDPQVSPVPENAAAGPIAAPLFVEGASVNASADSESRSRPLLGTLQLVVIMFYTVSGGPFGVEASVRAGGVFYTLLGLLVLPLVWSLPEALVTAELGSTFPEPSGSVAWVEEAFGTAAGWMAGYLSWISGATDTTIYPVLFLDYLLQIVHTEGDVPPFLRYCVLAVISIGLTLVNYLGLNVVGEISILICIVSMSPFVLAVVLGIRQVEPQRWLQLPQVDDGIDHGEDTSRGIFPKLMMGGVLWRPFLNNMFWNLNSFDSGASFSAEVENPGRTFPRAMFWSVFVVFLGYFVPLLVILGSSNAPQSAWEDGYVATVISDEIGPWLGDWTVLSAGVSNIALFQAELSSDAYMLMGMADRGHLCSFFRARSRFGTPTYGLIAGLAVVLILSVSDLSTLVEMLNFNYGISLLMEYAAFLKLRLLRPDVHRPYRIPLGTSGCVVALVPPVFCTLLVLSLASLLTFAVSMVSITVGCLVYWASRTQHWRHCCDYSPLTSAEDIEEDAFVTQMAATGRKASRHNLNS